MAEKMRIQKQSKLSKIAEAQKNYTRKLPLLQYHISEHAIAGGSALARILKLPIIFERVPVQNGLKLYLVKNGNFLPVKNAS